ncbi:DUF1704 domain-containing protein [Candidatus Woesearchaeota archaeon]|nr:DUF1704 domain-containing protein [Candidatus Woesearchaeota archaeon]
MKPSDIFGEVDLKLFEISKKTRPIFYSTPVNEETQKEIFFTNNLKNPEFEFLPFDSDEKPEKLIDTLKSLKVPDGILKEVYQKKINELILLNELNLCRGNLRKRKKLSKQIFGVPSSRCFDFAKNILVGVSGLSYFNDIDVEYFIKELRGCLIRNNLNDWKIELVDKKNMVIHQETKQIFVGKNTIYAQSDIDRLLVHDVGWHVMRAANGFRQRLKLFVSGFPEYHSTEEGGALLVEQLTGKLEINTLRIYAARVLAVDAFYRGKSFKYIFDMFLKYGFSRDQSWNLAVRVFRGGGLGKDHLYIEGFLKMKEFIKTEEDIKLFYVGKIGFTNIELVKNLIKDKFVAPALFVPDFIKDIKWK